MTPSTNTTTMTMTTDYGDRVDTTPRQPARNSTYSVQIRPGSPLKQEVLASPEVESPIDFFEHGSPTIQPRNGNNRAYDQTHRWTVLAREAEADEVSILSVTSEEKGYYASLFPDGGEETVGAHEPLVEDSRTSSRLGSVISGFDEGAFIEHDHEHQLDDTNREEEQENGFSEIDFEDTTQLAPFMELPPTEPPPDDKKYVYYPLPIPKQLMLPPKLTGPAAAKDIPPIATFRPPPPTLAPRETANDALEAFLDTHETALLEDPSVVLQTEFDSNTLLGTLMNNLRDTKSEIKGRARTNATYVPGGKSLLEMDKEVVQRMHMGKALSSRGGRNWGSSGIGGSSGSKNHKSQTESRYHEDDDVFESVSLAEMEYREVDEDVPLAYVRDRIVTQRQDAEESLVERMKRLKAEKKRREEEEKETLGERLARLKMEQGETLVERKRRLQEQRKSTQTW